jgi:hypothetical protein
MERSHCPRLSSECMQGIVNRQRRCEVWESRFQSERFISLSQFDILICTIKILYVVFITRVLRNLVQSLGKFDSDAIFFVKLSGVDTWWKLGIYPYFLFATIPDFLWLNSLTLEDCMTTDDALSDMMVCRRKAARTSSALASLNFVGAYIHNNSYDAECLLGPPR